MSRHVAGAKAGASRRLGRGSVRSRQKGGSGSPVGAKARRSPAGIDDSPMIYAASYAPTFVPTCGAPARKDEARRVCTLARRWPGAEKRARLAPAVCGRSVAVDLMPPNPDGPAGQDMPRTPTDPRIRMRTMGGLAKQPSPLQTGDSDLQVTSRRDRPASGAGRFSDRPEHGNRSLGRCVAMVKTW